MSEEQTTCCYAVQDKVWVDGPGGEPWEFYTVLADAEMPAAAPFGGGRRGSVLCHAAGSLGGVRRQPNPVAQREATAGG